MSQIHRQEHWYALQTRSNIERTVVTELDAKGIENFCPMFEELHQWADRKKMITRPVFPGYVFARFENSGPARLTVRKIHGTVRILGVADDIEPVPDKEIQSLRLMLKSGGTCFPHPYLREGCWVRVRRGALKGVEGLLVKIKTRMRLVLSVKLLSTSVATEVEARDVEVVRHQAVLSI